MKVRNTASSTVVRYVSIGNIKYKRNPRARRLTIRVKQTGEVSVTIPYNLSFKIAEDFVLSKKDWIIQKKEGIEIGKEFFDINTTITTQLFTLRTTLNDKISKPILTFTNDEANLKIPSSTKNPETINTLIINARDSVWKREAKLILPEKVKQLAEKHGFHYQKVSVRKAKTRWGSCSSKNNISLSMYLMKLPTYLVDYIILHELCHTLIKNHGPKFHELLNNVTNGSSKLLSKDLKKYRP